MPRDTLRIPNSGAPVKNSLGGNAVPGDGMQLRLAENQSSQDVIMVTTGFAPVLDTQATPIVVTLPSPSPLRRYKVNCHFELENSSADTSGDALVGLEVSYDGGSTWDSIRLAQNEHSMPFGVDRLVGIDLVMTPGEDLKVPVPANAPSMSVRAVVAADADGLMRTTHGGNQGTFWLSLAELL